MSFRPGTFFSDLENLNSDLVGLLVSGFCFRVQVKIQTARSAIRSPRSKSGSEKKDSGSDQMAQVQKKISGQKKTGRLEKRDTHFVVDRWACWCGAWGFVYNVGLVLRNKVPFPHLEETVRSGAARCDLHFSRRSCTCHGCQTKKMRSRTREKTNLYGFHSLVLKPA